MEIYLICIQCDIEIFCEHFKESFHHVPKYEEGRTHLHRYIKVACPRNQGWVQNKPMTMPYSIIINPVILNFQWFFVERDRF